MFAALVLSFLSTAGRMDQSERAISFLGQLTTLRRKIELDDGSFGITLLSGLSLDDDGVIGRSEFSPPTRHCVYNTDSDGKADGCGLSL